MSRYVTQKSVHLKLDYVNAAWLEKWAYTDVRSKNGIINEAVALWVRLREAKTRFGMYKQSYIFNEACNTLGIDPSLNCKL